MLSTEKPKKNIRKYKKFDFIDKTVAKNSESKMNFDDKIGDYEKFSLQ